MEADKAGKLAAYEISAKNSMATSLLGAPLGMAKQS